VVSLESRSGHAHLGHFLGVEREDEKFIRPQCGVLREVLGWDVEVVKEARGHRCSQRKLDHARKGGQTSDSRATNEDKKNSPPCLQVIHDLLADLAEIESQVDALGEKSPMASQC
jgi:hypothetical protein